MILQSLRLLSFRAHAESQAAFAPEVNLIYGPNGAGKTNLLEAVHYLCLSKSFIASRDKYVLRKGAPYFELEGTFSGERRSKLEVRLVYVPGEGKKMFVNGAPLERLSEIVGRLPVVAFSQEDQALTAGGPKERRRFLNNILSQARGTYLDDLIKYRRALKQRNELLKQFQHRRPAPHHDEVLASWDAELVSLGSRIVARRARFIGAFSRFLEEAYAHVEAIAKRPTIEYDTFTEVPADADEDRVAEAYRRELSDVAQRERERGRTLIGPQRDELVFRLGDLEVRRYASQGQHRTFGMAVKIAKYFYLKDRLEETPILLLDDIFDNLDRRRSTAFLELLQTEAVGQSIITAARRGLFDEVVAFGQPGNGTIRVEEGTVQRDVKDTKAPLS